MVFVVYRYYEPYYKRIILITEGNKSQRGGANVDTP